MVLRGSWATFIDSQTTGTLVQCGLLGSGELLPRPLRGAFDAFGNQESGIRNKDQGLER